MNAHRLDQIKDAAVDVFLVAMATLGLYPFSLDPAAAQIAVSSAIYGMLFTLGMMSLLRRMFAPRFSRIDHGL
jgi:hypothetical protein